MQVISAALEADEVLVTVPLLLTVILELLLEKLISSYLERSGAVTTPSLNDLLLSDEPVYLINPSLTTATALFVSSRTSEMLSHGMYFSSDSYASIILLYAAFTAAWRDSGSETTALPSFIAVSRISRVSSV